MGIGVGTVVRIVLSKIGGIPLMGIPSGLTINGMPVTVQLTISPATLIGLATGGAGGLGGLINSITSGVGTNLTTAFNGSLNELFQNPIASGITEASTNFTTALGHLSGYEGGLDVSSLTSIMTSAGNNVLHTIQTFQAHTNRISGVAIPEDEAQYSLTDVLNLTSGLDSNLAANLNISVASYTNSLNRSSIVSQLQSNLALVNTAINSGNQNYVDSLVANITALKSNLDTSVNTDVTNFNKTLIKADTIGSVQSLAMAYNGSSAAQSLLNSVTKTAMNTAIQAAAGQLSGILGGGVSITSGSISVPVSASIGGVQVVSQTVTAPKGFIST